MAHHTYRTEAFILGSAEAGEANRSLSLFTRELGFVFAHATSIRHLRSKLRAHTQEYTLAHIGLVRGKNMWRLVNAIEVCNGAHALRGQPDALGALSRVFTLSRRLLHGEERNEYLFAALREMLSFLCSNTREKQDITRAEYVTVLRALFSLGYLEEKASFAPFLTEPLFTPALLTAMGGEERHAIAAINTSLKATQL